ncbi:MAG: DUF3987 domain-containing protein, partial [Gemmataceae bacterium]|nr:DUF3987 domain-containing protein [Gemmataceae bacterium]
PWPHEPDQREELFMSAGAVGRTPRGGRHLWFKLPGQKTWRPWVGELADNVDLRTGPGSFIIAPPSVGEQGEYELLDGEIGPPERLPLPPDWLIDAIDRVAERLGKTGRNGKHEAPSPMAEGVIPEGRRNTALASFAGSMRRRGLTAGEIAAALLVINERRCRPPLPDEEVRRIAESVTRYAPAIGLGDFGGETAEEEPYKPFPVELLPDPLREYAELAAKGIGVDPAYVAVPLLTACGAAVGATRRLELKPGWRVPPILWTALVGESGSGKSPALEAGLVGVRHHQARVWTAYEKAMELYENDVQHYERDQGKWRRHKGDAGPPPKKPQKPIPPRLVVSDTTLEAAAHALQGNPRGVLLARDELAGWLGSLDRYAKTRGGDLPGWLSTYNALPLTVDRKTSGVTYVPAACVCVTGGVQPGILRRVMTAEYRESGLLARLLLVAPPRRPKRWNEQGVDQRLIDSIAELFRRLYGFQFRADGVEPTPEIVRLTPEAKAVWLEHFDRHAAEQVELTGDLAAAWSKAEELPARLALILHSVESAWRGETGTSPIPADTMQRAVSSTAWFKSETRRVYETLLATGADDQLDRLARWIERQGGVTTIRDVQRALRRYRTAEAAETALNALVVEKRGAWEGGETTGQPKRFRLLSADTRRHAPTGGADG